MSRLAPAHLDDLEEGVGGGRPALDLDGEDAEEEDLDGGASGVPEGAGDAVLPGDVGRLEEGRGPGPLRDDDRGGEASLDRAAGRVELLGGGGDVEELLLHDREEEHDDGEADTEAKKHAVALARGHDLAPLALPRDRSIPVDGCRIELREAKLLSEIVDLGGARGGDVIDGVNLVALETWRPIAARHGYTGA